MRDKRKEIEKDEEIIEEAVTPDDVDLEEEENAVAKKLKKLTEKLRAADKEKGEYHDALQRARADFLNSRRRLEEQLERDKERIQAGFIEQLLPLADSFDMAMANTEVWESADENWRKGIEAIRNQLQSILQSHGVKEVESVGHPFDPERHEAVSTEKRDDATPPETVVAVLQKGYQMDGNLLRPAKVIISN